MERGFVFLQIIVCSPMLICFAVFFISMFFFPGQQGCDRKLQVRFLAARGSSVRRPEQREWRGERKSLGRRHAQTAPHGQEHHGQGQGWAHPVPRASGRRSCVMTTWCCDVCSLETSERSMRYPSSSLSALPQLLFAAG